jgi:predicted dienelactone hydrolase
MPSPLSRLAERLSPGLARARAAVALPEVAWRGAAVGVVALTALVLAVDTAQYAVGTAAVVSVALGVPLGLLLAAALGALLVLAVRLLAALPRAYRWAFWGSLAVLVPAVFAGELDERLLPALGLVAIASIGGGAVATLRSAVGRGGARRAALSVMMVASFGSLLYLSLWYFSDRPVLQPVIADAAKATGVDVPSIDLPDPSQPGPYAVQTLTYGSGTDLRRPEFGAGVALRTEPFDGTPFLSGWSGLDGALRTRFWGFDARRLPVNGRVWSPAGEGPFPVVLVVHGNHVMQEYSDTGYDYLGELLASRGFVFVSVDENFLNGAPWGKLAAYGVMGVSGENAARGVLLLEHLAALRRWSAAPDNPFSGKLDLDRVALIGHSRGGEAIAVAAAYNRMDHAPDDATIALDYHFGIRALVDLATSDKRVRPTGRPVTLEGVDLLALQGSADGDQEYFRGMQHYDRLRLGEGQFKAALYVHRANHGQWSRAWGRRDLSQFPKKWLLDTTALLPAADQERVAKVYVAAFLEAALHGERGYLPLLRDHRAGARWLPDTIYVNRYEESGARVVSRFDEDADVSTTTVAGGRAEGRGLAVWREQPVGRVDRWLELDNKAVYLGWDAGEGGGEASYALTLPEGVASGASVLTFCLADAGEGASAARGRRRGKREGGAAVPIDLTVELVDAKGARARLALSEVLLVQPQLEVRIWKARLYPERSPEPVLQTYELALSRFAAAAPELDLASIRAVRFVFDKTPSGVVILDDVGFR